MSKVKISNRTVESAVKTLYLDEETADVHFVLNSNGQSVRVPAHKTLLIAASKVFRAMFNGQWKENDVVPIPDVLVADFKAFLQYFYLSKVKLSTENVDGVMSLSHQYDIEAGFNDCASILEHNLSVDNVCLTYKIALFYDHEQLKSECEIFISLNTEDVLKSSGFLECDRETLSNILRLEKMNCTETIVFYACMDWMNAVTKEDEITKELVAKYLGNVFYDIRFGAMTLKEFNEILTSFESLFSTLHQTEIKKLIRSKIKRWKLFNGNARMNPWKKDGEIECDGHARLKIDKKQVEFTRFSTNKTILLNAVVCSEAYYKTDGLDHSMSEDFDDSEFIALTVARSELTVREIDPFDDKKQQRVLYQALVDHYGGRYWEEVEDDSEDADDKGIVRFTKPIVIRRRFNYEVRLEPTRQIYAKTSTSLRFKAELESGISVKFYKGSLLNVNGGNLIAGLMFGTV